METRHDILKKILKKPVIVELDYFSYVEIKSAVHHEVYIEIASSTQNLPFTWGFSIPATTSLLNHGKIEVSIHLPESMLTNG